MQTVDTFECFFVVVLVVVVVVFFGGVVFNKQETRSTWQDHVPRCLKNKIKTHKSKTHKFAPQKRYAAAFRFQAN